AHRVVTWRKKATFARPWRSTEAWGQVEVSGIERLLCRSVTVSWWMPPCRSWLVVCLRRSTFLPEEAAPVGRHPIVRQPIIRHVNLATVEEILPGPIRGKRHVYVRLLLGEIEDDDEPLLFAVAGRAPTMIDDNLFIDVQPVT